MSFSVQLIFPWELATLGTAGTFLLYGIFGALGLVFVLIMVPETKGKSLEELDSSASFEMRIIQNKESVVY